MTGTITADVRNTAETTPTQHKSLWQAERRRARWKLLALLIILLAVFLASFNLGRYDGISLSDITQIMISRIIPLEATWPAEFEKVILYIRFPRIMSAVLVGAALALAGAA
ncbi:MAG: iron chelate uptake ABC transporter family permease subunit, partial [Propioniciclava sp.]